MAHFRLLWGSRSLELDLGATFFGRGDECELRTDDPLVSRQHARFDVADEEVAVEDLGSRNGIVINSNKIAQRTTLNPGDRIRIGSQTLTFLFGRATGSWNEPAVPTRRFGALGVVGELADKAMALGHFEEAERLVEGPFQQVLDDVGAGVEPSGAVVEKATDLAVRLASSTLRAEWIDRLIRLYSELGQPWPAEVVDSLYGIARRVSGVDRAALREYVLKLKRKPLGPADRFLLGRIDGLERQLAVP